MRTLTVGILEMGIPPEGYREKYGSYPDMFSQLLSKSDSQLSFKFFPILDGDIPGDPQQCDAWLITGSKYGVYEDHCWIEPVSDLIRAAYSADIPMIGICFGHQLIAQALGGKVQKSDKGWSLGVTEYQIHNKMPWITDDSDRFAIQAYHQDQVIELPKDTQVVAASDFCPYAALNFNGRAISFQGHPEFAAQYTKALLINRRGLKMLPRELSTQAIENIDKPIDQSLVGTWICQFLRHKLSA
ncbi:MAG: hypothetical protein OFPI_19530 [Osedax symbiont Rs2]|nr:MAG: hypothetical protein OFPI_19530 [Osedax symbiont Rs2]